MCGTGQQCPRRATVALGEAAALAVEARAAARRAGRMMARGEMTAPDGVAVVDLVADFRASCDSIAERFTTIMGRQERLGTSADELHYIEALAAFRSALFAFAFGGFYFPDSDERSSVDESA